MMCISFLKWPPGFSQLHDLRIGERGGVHFMAMLLPVLEQRPNSPGPTCGVFSWNLWIADLTVLQGILSRSGSNTQDRG